VHIDVVLAELDGPIDEEQQADLVGKRVRTLALVRLGFVL
jgi:hypothetical protein